MNTHYFNICQIPNPYLDKYYYNPNRYIRDMRKYLVYVAGLHMKLDFIISHKISFVLNKSTRLRGVRVPRSIKRYFVEK
jgi:hypothetical protein